MKIVSTENAPAAIGPYSQAIIHNGMVFCSGQISLTAAGEGPVGDTVEDQTVQVMKNIDAVLTAAGTSLDKVVKTTIFLTDMNDFAAVNKVYGEAFGAHRPARSTVAVSALPKGVKVEIEVLAAVE
ncbi:MAG TPA: RidA family protein [Phycisphaerales bacterium]|nr:RidA family protein [Phycisphaerales bacterium]